MQSKAEYDIKLQYLTRKLLKQEKFQRYINLHIESPKAKKR